MNPGIPLLWTLAWATVFQVLLFRFGIFWGGYGLLAVHLYALFRMPVGWSPTAYLVVAAGTGAVMDVVCCTGGMHLAACTTLGMAYPSLIAAMESRDGLRQGHVMNPHQDGWGRYAVFVAFGLAIHWMVLFGLQNGWGLMGRTLAETAVSTGLNVGVFLLLQGLFNRPGRTSGGAASAYPWS